MSLSKLTSMERTYLYDLLKQQNLVEFIEQTAQVKFNKTGQRYVCRCPMPNHNDSTPSFQVNQNQGIWMYTCFGCGSGGTIIDFYLDYYGWKNPGEALVALAEHFNLAETDDLLKKAIENVKIGVDSELNLEAQHIQTASLCRKLRRKFGDLPGVEDWVNQAYQKLNLLLQEGDLNGIRQIEESAMRYYSNGGRLS